MAKQVATPKQTAGGGFSFENKVGAYYAVLMLRGQAPFALGHGTIIQMGFHRRGDGWFLDDFLLTLESSVGEHRYAFSVKSSPQFTKSSAPADFVRAAWEQFLHEGSEQFIAGTDMLGLITAPHPDPPKQAVQELLRKAREQDASALAKRITKRRYASAIERRLFASFACPGDLAQARGVDDSRTGKLLAHVIVKELDFENAVSENESGAVGGLSGPCGRRLLRRCWSPLAFRAGDCGRGACCWGIPRPGPSARAAPVSASLKRPSGLPR